jgi:polyphosphate glucokinase
MHRSLQQEQCMERHGAIPAASEFHPRDSAPDAPAPTSRLALGIDVGGTGIKAAVVDLNTGSLASARAREKTPQPSTPEAVVRTVARIVGSLTAAGVDTHSMPAGAGLPGVVKDGRLMTAANIDPSWIGAPAACLISERLGRPVLIVNDADAAGLAEMRFGEGRGERGTVLMITIGTGIGAALFVDGRLVPNLELGHIEFHGRDAETLISGASRERRHLGWKRWAREFGRYLDTLSRYLWPDLVILGGGVSKESSRFLGELGYDGRIRVARFLNAAGIVGAALFAAEAAAEARSEGCGPDPDPTQRVAAN